MLYKHLNLIFTYKYIYIYRKFQCQLTVQTKKNWVDNEYGLWHNAILIDELDK